ncbi:hypothetical protein CUR178_01852 [Leishmania enriettii]|uniref:Guanine nucleotide-binding protein subunit beta-like protein n=1 Tax=Leishmania enriettii TaxID=5663 RepID=A0A836GTM4_LEIEN|nr:hypothetical protein CUR178_01852 [Leishmania enriettii]
MGPPRSGRKRLVAVQNGARANLSKDASPLKCIHSDGPPLNALATSSSETPGGRPASPPTAFAGATTAMSSNAARYAAACAANMDGWILAIKQPSPPTETFETGALSDVAVERGMRNAHSTIATANGSRRHSSAAVVAHLPLEERIGLPELKSIMRAFQVPASGAGGQPSEPPSNEGPRSGIADHMIEPQTLEMLHSIDELSAIAADLPESLHSAHPNDRQGARDAAGALSSAASKRHKHSAVSPCSLSEPTLVFRKLSQEEFTQAIQSAVATATLPEIQALLTKAISETQETVSWNDLVTFLVTRSRQKADLALENQRFVLGGPPYGMRFDGQHSSSITCVAVEPERRLFVTGCSEGSVRAWSSGSDLAYRGLLLQVDKWIVGLHWGCKQRVLYVVTMDRWVYILDGTTYEVLRVYHGRGITESSANITYASETIGTVHVGGVAPTKRTVSSARSRGGPHFHPKGLSSLDTLLSPRTHANRVGSRESHEERMRRLLSSAMHPCRAMHSAGKGAANAEPSRRRCSAQADGTSAKANVGASTASAPLSVVSSPPAKSTVATVYSLTIAGAAEALHQENTPLTGAGRGPYVRQQLDEGVLTALVDPVTATAFHESAFQEDVLLLGTSVGDVFLFQLAQQHHLDAKLVLVARHVFRQLHRGRVTKLDLLLSLHALVSSGDDGHVRVTSLVTGQPLRSFYAADLPEQHASVTDFHLHPQLKMLLTVGPERHALVWEWTQAAPIALLGPANSPCCGGVFVGDRVVTISRDRVLHVYDCKGFHLQQELSLATASSLDRLGGAVGTAHFAISKMHVDEGRQRVLCFGHFPVSLCVKWQVSTAFPERYRGHYVPIFATLSSRTFGQVVTVGTDGVVMTWTPRTGVNEFSFLLSNFSNETTASAPLQPTAASMDVLQRCLLTGFANGTMVVWSILNGQVERVLTAASWGTAKTTLKPTSGRSNPSAAPSVDHTTKATTAVAISSSRRDVTAVGSFLRHRSVSYIFAIGSHLYVDAAADGAGATALSNSPQLGEYSTTPASFWAAPSALGEVTRLLQLGPQLVGCATASGAVLLYNVLFDGQEGAPLWVSESLLSPSWATGSSLSSKFMSITHGDAASIGGASALPWRSGVASAASTLRQRTVPGTTTLFLESLVNAADTDPATALAATTGAVVSRVSLLMTLPAVHPRLLIVGQEDGTVCLWHTLRRLCLGAVSLASAAGVEDAKQGEDAVRGGVTGGGTAVVAMDIEEAAGQVLVFGDGEGNVHVCRLKWRLLTDSHEQATALAMPNLALYCSTPASTKTRLPTVETSAVTSSEDVTAAERSLPVLQQLERVHVFASGLMLSGIRVVHAQEATSTLHSAVPPRNRNTDTEASGTSPEQGNDGPEPSVSMKTHRAADRPHLVIFCTGVDHYVRVFTLAGVPIGELGMDEWDTTRPSTFRYTGEPTTPPAVPLRCSLAGNWDWQQEGHDTIKGSRCYHDYLAELYATHHTRPAMLVGSLRMLASSGSLTLGGRASLRRTMGGTAHLDTPATPSSRVATRAPLATCPAPSLDVVHFAGKAGSNAALERLPSHGTTNNVLAESAEAGADVARELSSHDTGRFLQSDLRPDPTSPREHCLSARLGRNTRHHYDTDRCFRGLLKRSYARELQHRHRQACTSPLSPAPQPPVAPSELPNILLSSPVASTAAVSAHAETVSNALPAANMRSSLVGQSEAAGHFISPLARSTVTSAGLLDEPQEPANVLMKQHSRVASMVHPPNDVEGPMKLSRASTASTDAPHSAVESPRDRAWPSCETAAVALSISAAPQDNPGIAEAPFLDLPPSEGSSLGGEPSPVSAVDSDAQWTRANTQASPSSHSVSTSRPMSTAAAHGGGGVAFSGLVPANAAPRDAAYKAAAPLPSPAFLYRRGSAAERQESSSALAFLSHERARLAKSACTTAAREQLAALVMPSLTHPVSSGVAGGSAVTAALPHLLSTARGAKATFSSSAPFSPTPVLDVHRYVDSILERRRAVQGCRAPGARELEDSSKRLLAEVASRMYLAPVKEPTAPSSDFLRPHHSATPPPSRMRQ